MRAKWKKTALIAVASLVIFVLLGVLYALYITELLSTESRMHLSEVATQGAASVQRQVARDFDILEVLADGSISNPDIPLSAKMERITEQANKFGLYRIGIVDLEGKATTSDGFEFSVADRDFFKAAVKGERFLTNPIIDKVDGVTPGIVYAVPVYHEGKVVSVLFSGYELKKLTERIDISFYHESGLAFITDSKANVILHPISERTGTNIIEIATSRNSKKIVEEFKNNLLNGVNSVSHLVMRTEDRFFAYAPIKGANDWFLVTSLPATTVFERSMKVIFLTVILLVLVTVLFSLAALYIALTKRKADAKTVQLAYFDTLTGAANAERFKLDAADLFSQFGAKNYLLLNFDVKQFRYINNDLGYSAGNNLLKHIVSCLALATEKNETYARAGTDQFLVLLFGRGDAAKNAAHIERICSLISAWEQPSGGCYSVTLAVGAYNIEDSEADVTDLIDKANIARKSAKKGYETDIQFYGALMQEKIFRATELEKAMPLALENGEFKLFIQPQYDLINGKIVGGEALVRWIKADGSVIMPDEFISIFEQSDAIYRMDMYMLSSLCKFLRSQLDRGSLSVPISINQSRRYMYMPTYVESICAELKKCELPPKMISLEITENIVYSDIDKLTEVLKSLHAAGFSISLDDFGSGYSSLNVLKNLQVDTLKLDRFMLSETLDSDREKIVVANIIRMGKELSMSIVAEGVETKEQVEFLCGCGCEIAQGYYYSKPIPAEKFDQMLKGE